MAVVVEIADERGAAAGVEHPLLDVSGTAAAASATFHRDPHHFRAGIGELDTLLSGSARVGRVRHRHRLDDDGRTAADLDVTDLHAHRLVEPHRVAWKFP